MMPRSFPQETIDDGLRGIRYREHAAVSLRLQRHAPLFEPGNRIVGKKTMEGFLYEITTPGIFLSHFTDTETGMCDIAAATAAYFDLAEQLV